jgi:hypothetical protein
MYLANVPNVTVQREKPSPKPTQITEIDSHLLPDRLDRAMNAVNLAPKTMAKPWLAEPEKRKKAQ